MTISFSCPHCNTVTNVGDQFAGQSGPCRTCGQTVTVPLPKGMAPVPLQSHSSSGGGAIVAIVLVSVVGFLMCGGVMVALLLPAVSAARGAARRMQSQNNLKQIGLALHNYHDVYKSFPPAYTVDADGKPLHSWRTLILPFVEQSALYNQIDLNMPWDSPKNQASHNVVVPTFRFDGDPNSPNCSYVVLVGPQTAFPGATTVKLQNITDGTSNSILVVELAGWSKNWMMPADLDATQMQFAINGGAGEISSVHPGGANILMADGSVRFFSQSVSPSLLKSATTINGGEPVQLPP